MNHLDREDLFRRPGRVLIPSELFDKYPLQVMLILSKLLIVEAKFDPMRKRFDYVGYSQHFRAQSAGSEAPIYEWEILPSDQVKFF